MLPQEIKSADVFYRKNEYFTFGKRQYKNLKRGFHKT